MKRLISFLLICAMVLSVVPANALAEQQTRTQVDQNDVTVKGNNALGGLIAEKIREQQAENAGEQDSGYVVLGMTVEGSTATVELETIEDARVMAALYSEDGLQLLASGTVAVTAGQTEVSVAIEGTVPEFFMARAYLLDNYDYSPLCKAYTTPMYTRQMQELLASTAEDYDADRVLTLDEDTSTNFVVYHENTLVIRPDGSSNALTLEDGTNRSYVIENADSRVTGLKAGDVVAYEKSAKDVLVVKVGSITVSGTTVTITGQDVELEEAFSHMKLEQMGDAGGVDQESIQPPGDGLTFNGIYEEAGNPTRGINVDLKASSSMGFTLEKDVYSEGVGTISVSGEYKLQLGLELAIYVSGDYQFVKFKIDSRLEGTFSVTGKVDLKLDMGVFAVNLYGVTVGFAPELHLTFSAKISLSAAVVTAVGFAYEKGSGFQNLCSWPKIEEPELTFEGTVFLGIDLCPTVRVLEGSVAKLDIHVPIGLELKGELYRNPHYETLEEYEGTVHHCDKCIEMELFFKVAPKVELKFLSCDFFKVEWEILSTSIKIEDFYYTLDTNTFGVGVCPNKSFRVTVAAEDLGSSPVEGAVVVYDQLPDSRDNPFGTTNENGIASTYMRPGIYNFRTEINGKPYEYSHYIRQAGKIVLGPNVKLGRNFIAEHIDPEEYVDDGRVMYEGVCGEDLIWKLYESGHLWITGRGPMTDYSYYTTAPWEYYSHLITRVVFDDGVESVGSRAFYFDYNDLYGSYSKLTEVYLNDDLKSIGQYAFVDIINLKTINFPSELTTIGYCAFDGCESLEEITIPAKVTEINSYAFRDTRGLKTLNYEAVNANPDTDYHHIFVRAGMNSGGFEAFIDKNVQRIPAQLFAYNSDGSQTGENFVTNVVFAPGSQCKEIGSYALSGKNLMKELILPEGLEIIKDHAFAEASIESIYIPGTVHTIEKYAFSHANGLKEISIPASVTTLGDSMFYSCDALQKVTFNGGVTAVPDDFFQECTALETVQLSDGITAIGSQAFYNCTSLQFIELPASVGRIKESGFEKSGLVSIELGKNLYAIERYAFRDCDSLKGVVIPDSVQIIQEQAFANNDAMESLHLGSGAVDINTNIVLNTPNLTRLTVSPDNATLSGQGNCIIVTSAKRLFLGCKGSVIPTDGTVTSIGAYAFAYNDSITQVQIPDVITSVKEYAFADCDGLQAVIIGNGVTKIESNAFASCDALEAVTFGTKLATISYYAFTNCKALKTLQFPDSLKTIDMFAFDGCEALEEVHFGPNLKTIATYAFDDCKSLKAVVIPDSVTSLGDSAFRGCTALTEVTVGSGITKISNSVFSNDKQIQCVIFRGDAPTLGNKCFSGVTATIYYPADNATWVVGMMTDYGGTLTWTAYDPAVGVARTAPVKRVVTAAQEPTETLQAEAAVQQEAAPPATRAIYPGEQESVVENKQTIRTATFENLVPGQEYLMLAMVSMEAEELLAPENILYIHQAPADENGVLTVQYIQRVTTGKTYIMACGASHNDLSNAEITFPTMTPSKQVKAIKPTVRYDGKVLTEGMDYVLTGNVEYTKAGEYTCNIRGIYNYSGTVTCTYTVTDAVAITTNGQETAAYTTLADAITHYESGTIQLLQDIDESVVVSKDLQLELDGYDITGAVTVSNGATLWVQDRQTDDYTVQDAGGYGKLTAVSGTVKAADGYMAVTEETGISFHRVEMLLTDMVLRPSAAGVYYKSEFAGDEVVAANVTRHGVALSVQGAPTAENPGVCAWYENFGEGINSTLLTGVMKTSRTEAENAQIAAMQVYGSAYILTADGQYIFGACVSRSLQQQVELADTQWESLTAEQKTQLLEMYETYAAAMQDWQIPNLKAA